jgi:hypothetical protein
MAINETSSNRSEPAIRGDNRAGGVGSAGTSADGRDDRIDSGRGRT